MESYKEHNLAEEKNSYMILAALGFLGLGGLHRFKVGMKTSDEQQYFLGGIFLLPLVLFILLWFLGDSFKAWYLAPFAITYGLTLFDLLNMDKLLSGELSAKKAWYETWPGRIGAIILFPVALWFLYAKTDLPKSQKNAIAGALAAGLALFLGASFTGLEELATDDAAETSEVQEVTEQSEEAAADSESKYANCDEVRAAGEETPLTQDHPEYANYLDRDSDGLACE